MGVDYDNGLIVGMLIGKEISPRGDKYLVGDKIINSHLKWDSVETIDWSDPGTISIVGFKVDTVGNTYMIRKPLGGTVWNTIDKVSPSGEVLWSVTLEYGIDNGANLSKCVLDNLGNFYVFSLRYVGYPPTDGGNYSAWVSRITKISPSGVIDLEYNCVGQIRGIAVTNVFGDIYVAWYLYDQRDASRYYAVLKIDSTGNNVWQYAAPIGTQDYKSSISGVAADGSRNVYACYDAVNLYLGNPVVTLRKLDHYGSVVWVDSTDSHAIGVITDIFNNVYASYYYVDPVTSQAVGILKKFDSDGNLLWSFQITDNAKIRDVRVDSRGFVLLLTECFADAYCTSNYILTPAGKLVWSKNKAFAECCAVDSQDNFYVSYYYNSLYPTINSDIKNATINKLSACDHYKIIGPIPPSANFFIAITTYDDSAPKITARMVQLDNSEEYSNVNARVTGKLSVSGVWPHLTYSLGFGSPVIHNDIQIYINRRNVLTITVSSRARKNIYDLVGLTLDIENNTIYPVEIYVWQDDVTDPRFILGVVTGGNLEVTVL